jgi:hypothetical protein
MRKGGDPKDWERLAIATEIEDHFEIAVSDEEALAWRTVGDIQRFVMAAAKDRAGDPLRPEAPAVLRLLRECLSQRCFVLPDRVVPDADLDADLKLGERHLRHE